MDKKQINNKKKIQKLLRVTTNYVICCTVYLGNMLSALEKLHLLFIDYFWLRGKSSI